MRDAKRAAQFAVQEWRFRRVYEKYKRYTMVSKAEYADNLRLATRVMAIKGSIVECGTWRGGMIAGIAEVLGGARQYYLCDSFQGLPPAKEVDGDAARVWQQENDVDNCCASEEDVKRAMSLSSVKNYEIIKGWFEDTLPDFPSDQIALLRMDADWYESTRCILHNLFERMVPEGLIIVDDYYTWQGCTVAVNEFAARNNRQIRQSHRGVCYLIV